MESSWTFYVENHSRRRTTMDASNTKMDAARLACSDGMVLSRLSSRSGGLQRNICNRWQRDRRCWNVFGTILKTKLRFIRTLLPCLRLLQVGRSAHFPLELPRATKSAVSTTQPLKQQTPSLKNRFYFLSTNIVLSIVFGLIRLRSYSAEYPT